MKKLTKRAIASRANGKLSRGPVTPTGLLRSSANSTRHALLAENLVLDEESKDVFAILHQQFIDRLSPADGVEVCLVEDLASTVWRQRRLVAIETHLFKEAAAKRQEETYLGRIGGAFSDLCRTPDMHLLDRYESRLHRMFQRTLKNLELLRQIEHTDPSTGELTQFPPEFTDIPDAPADSATPELPNEPSNEQPPIESSPYPATSTGNPQPGNAEDISTGPTVPPAPPNAEIHELPNEPRSEQPPVESMLHLVTSTPESAPPAPTDSEPPVKPQPIDPYADYPRFQLNPITGALRRIA